MPLNNRFGRRYFEWCLSTAKAECSQNFKLLSRVRSNAVTSFITVARSMSLRERDFFCTAMVKRFRSQHPGMGWIELTKDDQEFVERFLGEFASHQAELTESSRPKLSWIKARILARLEAMPGRIISSPGQTIKHEILDSGWKLKTIVDFGHTWGPAISYGHSISKGGVVIAPGIHICDWMGIAAQSKWDCLQQGEEDETADSISCVVEWFAGRWGDLRVSEIN